MINEMKNIENVTSESLDQILSVLFSRRNTN